MHHAPKTVKPPQLLALGHHGNHVVWSTSRLGIALLACSNSIFLHFTVCIFTSITGCDNPLELAAILSNTFLNTSLVDFPFTRCLLATQVSQLFSAWYFFNAIMLRNTLQSNVLVPDSYKRSPWPRGLEENHRRKNVSIHCERERHFLESQLSQIAALEPTRWWACTMAWHTPVTRHISHLWSSGVSKHCWHHFSSAAGEWEGIRSRGAEARVAGRENGFHIYFGLLFFFTESTWESHFAVIWVYTSKWNQVWPFMPERWILAKNIFWSCLTSSFLAMFHKKINKWNIRDW